MDDLQEVFAILSQHSDLHASRGPESSHLLIQYILNIVSGVHNERKRLRTLGPRISYAVTIIFIQVQNVIRQNISMSRNAP